MTSPARIVITGATGFVGRSLASMLAREAVAISALVRPRHKAARALPGPVEEITGDLGSEDSLAQLVQGADVVTWQG